MRCCSILLAPLFFVCAVQAASDVSRNATTSTTASATSKTTTTSPSISVNPVLPAGGVDLQTPTSVSSTYVKSGDAATFGWNYTSLILSPSAINIEVTCTQNRQAYTLAQNQSLSTASVVWDTNKVSDNGGLHLVSAEYTLVIYDAAKSPSDVASAGELAPFQYVFGVYVPQTYKPWPLAAKYVNAAAHAPFGGSLVVLALIAVLL